MYKRLWDDHFSVAIKTEIFQLCSVDFMAELLYWIIQVKPTRVRTCAVK